MFTWWHLSITYTNSYRKRLMVCNFFVVARARTRDRACTVDKYACTNAMGDHVKWMERRKNVFADSDTTSIVPQRFTLISFNKFLVILSVQSSTERNRWMLKTKMTRLRFSAHHMNGKFQTTSAKIEFYILWIVGSMNAENKFDVALLDGIRMMGLERITAINPLPVNKLLLVCTLMCTQITHNYYQ